ncbi:MAG: glycosyltransferase [Bacillota bacterium]
MWHLVKIPKQAHFYWSDDRISFLRYMTLASFRKFNPGWRMCLYFPKYRYQGGRTWQTPEQEHVFSGPNYLDRLSRLNIERIEIDFENYGMSNQIPETFKADFWRWYLLGTVGGVWSDMDIIYFRPLEALYINNLKHGQTDMVICLHDAEHFHSIGFLMSAARNEFFKFVNQEAQHCLDLTNYQSIGSAVLNRHFPNMAEVKMRFPGLKEVNISLETVYPLNGVYIPYIFHTGYLQYLTDKTIGLHWYAGHPAAGEFENILNEHNFFTYSSILTNVIGRAI